MAPHHLPSFIPAADGSDPMFTNMAIFLVVMVLVLGNYYLKLHALPERLAHGKNHFQTQAITVLALLALFTHNNVFWVGALLLAVVRFPDFQTPLDSIAGSLRRINGEPPLAPRDDGGNQHPPAKTEH
jgi:multisubunit Na+/H+ antiporter MnhF subunit